MKKIWILLGLIVLVLFVVSCAPKEGDNIKGEAFFPQKQSDKSVKSIKEEIKNSVQLKKPLGDCFPGYYNIVKSAVPEGIDDEELFLDLGINQSIEYNSKTTPFKNGKYMVIVPEGYEYFGSKFLEKLPNCEKAGTKLMGYCKPFTESKYYFFKTTTTEEHFGGKVSKGVVYIDFGIEQWKKYNSSEFWENNKDICGINLIAHESLHTFINMYTPLWANEGLVRYFSAINLSFNNKMGKAYCNYETSELVMCMDESCKNTQKTSLSVLRSLGPNHKNAALCMWDKLFQKYGSEKMQKVFYKMMIYPPTYKKPNGTVVDYSVGVNPASFASYYLVPILGEGVWEDLEQFGITKD